MILGTAAYMSPEQAKGRTVDRRADVWAFGTVLYEMLTGQRAFAGEDVSDTLASVLKMEPAWERLPAEVPARIRQVLRACLQKNAKQRIGDVQDVRLALEGVFETTVPGTAAPAPALQPRPLWRRALPVIAAAVVAGAMVGAAAWTLRPPVPSSPVTRFALALGEGQQFTVDRNRTLAVSPDGTRLVYAANNQLYLRSTSDLEARPIPGTQQTPPSNPVFSPDGQSIAFSPQVDRAVKKIAVSGGAAVTVCPVDDAASVLGMTGTPAGSSSVGPKAFCASRRTAASQRCSSACGGLANALDPFFFRLRSIRARSARVGVSMPEAWASVVRNS